MRTRYRIVPVVDHLGSPAWIIEEFADEFIFSYWKALRQPNSTKPVYFYSEQTVKDRIDYLVSKDRKIEAHLAQKPIEYP